MKAITYPRLKTDKGIPYTRQHVCRLEKTGDFPHHFHLGENSIAWDADEIDEWLENRKALGPMKKTIPEGLRREVAARKEKNAAARKQIESKDAA